MAVIKGNPEDSTDRDIKAQHDLRRRAEGQVGKSRAGGTQAPSLEEARRLIQELSVHQIELEMQNEEQRRTQAALETSQERFIDLYDQAPVGYVTLSDDGKILEANLTATALLAIPRERLVKRRLTDFIAAEDQDIYYLCQRNLFRTGERQVVDLHMLHQNSARWWARLEAVLVKDEASGVKTCQIIISNVDDRKKIEEDLRQTRESFERFFEDTPIGLYRTTPQGQIVRANPALLRTLGYQSFEELAQRNLEEFYFELDYPRSHFRTLLESQGEVKGLEAAWKKQDGATIYVRENARVVRDAAGQVEYYEGSIEDITASKQAQRALQESEERYRRIVETSHEGIWERDENNVTTYVNQRLADMLGYRPEEMIGMLTHTFALETDLVEHYRQIEERKMGRSGQYQRRYLCKDGSILWANVSAVPIFDRQGSFAGSHAMLTDITARKQAELELERERSLMDALMEYSADAIYFMDNQLRYLRVSRATALKEGIQDPEGMIGKSDFDFFTPKSAKEFQDLEMEIMRTGKPAMDQEQEEQRPGRPTTWASTTEVPLRDAAGQIVGIIGISRDITERKRVELELEQERNLLNALMDTTPDNIYFKDTQLRFVRASRTTALRQGLQQPELLIGKTDFDLYDRETAQQYYDEEMEILRSGQPVVNQQYKVVRAGQPDRWVESTELPLRDAAGQVIGVFAISRYITDRKRAELELEQERSLLKALMDSSPDSIYFKDTQLRFIRVSRTTALREGFQNPDLLIGKTDFDIFDHKTAQDYYDSEMEIIRSGQAVLNREEGGQRPGEDPRWYLDNEVPLRDAAGQVIGVFAISRDITARKNMEEAFERERGLMNALMDNSPDAIYFKDANLHYLRLNRAAALKEGVQQPEEMIGKSDFDYYSPESAQEYHDLEMEIMRSGVAVVDLEQKEQRPGLPTTWASTTEVPLRDPAGQVVGVFGVTRDITERKEIERALIASEERLSLALEAANDGLWDRDLVTGQVYLSPRYCSMLGYTPDELRPHETVLEKIAHPEDLPAIRQAEQDYAAGQRENYAVEFRALSKGGEIVWIRSRGKIVEWDAEGRPMRMVGTHVDITQSKQIEAALRESESRFRTLIEHAPVAINVSREGKNLYANQKLAQLFGFPDVATAVGRPTEEFYAPQYQEESRERIRRRYMGLPVPAEIESVGQRRDGTQFPMHVAVAPVEMSDGPASVSFLTDISERKNAEETLRKSEAIYRRAIEGANAVPYQQDFPDVNGTRDYRFTFIGEGIRQLTGYGPEEFTTEVFDSMVVESHPVGDLASYTPNEAVDLVRRGALPYWKCEWLMRTRDGRLRWIFEASVDYFDENGVPTSSIGLFQDITATKHAEETLRKSEAIYRKAIEGADAVPYQQKFPHGTDPEKTEYSFIGEGIQRLTGYTAAEFTDELFDTLVVESHPLGDLSAYSLNEAVALVRSGALPYWKCEWLIRARDGKLHWLFEASVDYFDDDGVLTSSIGLYQDITASKQTEEALRESQAIYRKAIEVADAVPFRQVFKQGSDAATASFDFIGEGIQRLTGYTPAEFTNKLFDARVLECHLLGDLAQYQYKEAVAKVRSGALPYWKCEWLLRTKDGKPRWIFEAAVDQHDENGVALSSIGLFQDITVRKQHEREVEAIAAVSASLRTALTRAEMLPLILDQVMDLFQASGAALITPEPNSSDFTIEIARGGFEQVLGLRAPADSGVPGQVLQSGQPYLNNNAIEDPLFLLRNHIPNARALAGLPLIVKSIPIGVLLVASAVDISTADLHLMTAIADIAANAIYRATLFDQTERRLRYISAVQQIDSAISSSLDLRVTFNVLLSRTLEQLHADAGDVLILDPYLHRLEYLSGKGFLTPEVENTHLKMGECLAGRAAMERRSTFIPDLTKSIYPLRSGGHLAAEKFVAYHALPLIAKGEVKGVLEVYYRRPPAPEADALNLLETISGQAAIAIDNSQMFQSLQRSNMDLILAYDATIEGWSHALDLRDKEAQGHTRRITELAEHLAAAMNLSWEEQSQVRRGSLLHDIGKMGIPDHILLKQPPLTEDERAILRQHPQLAFDMLSPIAYLRRALDIPYCHHERWDGTGYPRQLKGGQIPLTARIFTVVDVWDAITSGRHSHPVLTKEQAIEHIRAGAGAQFDPQVVEAFLGMISGI